MRSRSLVVALVLAALFGLAVAGGSVFRGAGTQASAADALPYAALGAGAALVLAGLAAWAARQIDRSSRLPSLGSLAAIGFLVAALGALIGASLTPETPDIDQVSPLTEEETQRRAEQQRRLGDTVVRPVDRDGDGVPDTDAEGNLILAYDEDGDGFVDGYLQPCPEPTYQTVAMRRPAQQPLDIECDGEIDAYLEFDPIPFTGPELQGPAAAPPPEAPPATAPAEEQQERADEQRRRADEQSASGRFDESLLYVLIGIAAAALLAVLLVMWSKRQRQDEPDVGDPHPSPPDDAGDVVAVPIRRTIDTVERDPDPRVAICEAYGTLLAGLADVGLPRRPEEAPVEHITRCLAATPLDEASVTELVDLFGLARFSSHPVTEAHREAALRCLQSALPSRDVATVGASPGGAWPPPAQ